MHEVFAGHYKKSLDSFDSVIHDTGLGIGIDFGEITLSNRLGGLTIIGEPVVYACRLGGAKAGETWLNQQAYVEIKKRCIQCCGFEDRVAKTKEADLFVRKVFLRELIKDVPHPDWLDKLKKSEVSSELE